VRTASGTIITYDAPGSGTSANQGTGGGAINALGVITGSYTDASNMGHGFVLTPANTLTSSPNPSTYGQAVTFTATMTSIFGPPPDGETVSFMKGKTLLGTGTLSGGSATFTTSKLKVGTTSVTAVYAGDAGYAGSTSNTLEQVVQK
jgi:hypothetical protein